MNQDYLCIVLFFIFILLNSPPCASKAAAQGVNLADSPQARQRAFEYVFGEAVRLDPAVVEKARTEISGKHYVIDRDGDGKPEEVWFIDTHPRHHDSNRPILVRVIDEDGDLGRDGTPDRDSDLYLADWHADGSIDAVIDYEDLDGDQDVDRLGMFFYDPQFGLRTWLFIDDGDDNRLAYDVNYTYDQEACQEKSHFGGNESVISLSIKPGERQWTPFWENPFLFFDEDRDGITEEAIRVEGKDDLVHYLRWSLNVDPVAGRPRDFDVSLTACAPGWTEGKGSGSDFHLRWDKRHTESLMVRGIPTGPILKRSAARDALQSIDWARVLMTWDEINLNIAWNKPDDQIPRWEGVIAAPLQEPGFIMPQVGGPHCGPFNKRYELALRPTGGNAVYFHPADQRLHLKHSNKTWLTVDYDGDSRADMHYQWSDGNGDGVMDRLCVDVDGDDQADDCWRLDVASVSSVNWSFADLHDAFAPVIAQEPERKYRLVQALTAALDTITAGGGQEPIRAFMENRMQGAHFSAELAKRLIASDVSLLYFLTLLQDRQIAKLRRAGAGDGSRRREFWQAFDAARGQGNTEAMTRAVRREFDLGDPAETYDTWTARLRR